jgi:hypothetical protein
MTGQVKEEIITRLGELGVSVRDGTVRFDPVLLRRSEFLREPQTFEYYDVAGRRQSMELAADTLAFTYCQVPIVYRRSDEPHFMLHFADGTDRSLDGLVLDADASAEVFRRSGKIVRIEVSLAPGLDG